MSKSTYLQQALSNLEYIIAEMRGSCAIADPVLQCWIDKLDTIRIDLTLVEEAKNAFCEHCGPVTISYMRDGTSWCEACLEALDAENYPEPTVNNEII